MLPGEHIEITREGNAGQQVGEKDIDSTRYDELIENGPVRDVTLTKMFDILLQQPPGSKTVRETHNGDYLTLTIEETVEDLFGSFSKMPFGVSRPDSASMGEIKNGCYVGIWNATSQTR